MMKRVLAVFLFASVSLPALAFAASAGPGVVLTADSPDHAAKIFMTAVFSAPVTGFIADDISVTGEHFSIEDFVASTASVYTFTVTPNGGDPTLVVSVPAGSAVDAGNTPNTDSNTITRSLNTETMHASISASKTVSEQQLPAYINASTTLYVQFSTPYPPVDFAPSSISITNGVADSIVDVSSTIGQVTGTVFSFIIIPSADGAVTISIPKNILHYALPGGKSNLSSNSLATLYDATPPTIASTSADVTVQAAAGATSTLASWSDPTASDPAVNGVQSGFKSLSCTHASGSLFPLGKTTVVCTALDNVGNATTSQFAITVLGSSLSLATTTGEGGFVSGSVQSDVSPLLLDSGAKQIAQITISKDTTITGSSTWNGIVTLPTATTTYTAPSASGFTIAVSLAIEIGAGDMPLTFDKPVKIVFSGKAGTPVGWSQAGVFHAITAVCDSATNPTLGAGADCHVDSGSDLVVWTMHFSTFLTYTQTAVPAAPATPAPGGSPSTGSGSSSGGGGGGSTSSGSSSGGGLVLGAQTGPATTALSTSTPAGRVLGASAYNFKINLGLQSRGAGVNELQKVLIAEGWLTIKAPTGYFGLLTYKAVKGYQKGHGVLQTGFVGALTRGVLNKGG